MYIFVERFSQIGLNGSSLYKHILLRDWFASWAAEKHAASVIASISLRKDDGVWRALNSKQNSVFLF